MILTGAIRKSLLISLAGHIAAFNIAGFSFGAKMPAPKICAVNFWGEVLGASDLMNAPRPEKRLAGTKHTLPLGMPSRLMPENNLGEKPRVSLSFNEDKLIFEGAAFGGSKNLKAKEPVIMLYPALPYDASLYFKDRQAVHIELMFNVLSSAKHNSILIKRRISSGNLEADLLSMRNIARYLFIQQGGFSPNEWHKVKIDLSTRY